MLIIHVMAPTFFNHLCPSLTAQSIPTDQPRPIIQSFGQAQRLPLPQGYRQGQLRKGFACTPSHGWQLLRCQSLTEEGHSQEEGGMCACRHVFEFELAHKLQAYHARCVHVNPPNHLSLFQSGKTHYVREECVVEECQAPVLGGPALFFPNSGQTVLHLGLHQWRRSELLAQLLTRRKMDSLIYLMLELRSNKLEDNFEIEEETKGKRGTRRDL